MKSDMNFSSRLKAKIFLWCIIVIIFVFQSNSVFCQNQLLVKGQVIDAKTSKPIPFATVSLKGKTFGSITNDLGEFIFRFSNDNRYDTIHIISLGYISHSIPVNEALKIQYHIVKLDPKIYSLKEVVVQASAKKMSANKIVQKAIDNILLNYPIQRFQYTGYYRDYLKYNNNYLNLIEAALMVEDQGWQSGDSENTHVRLLQFKYNRNYPFDESKVLNYDNKTNKLIPSAKMPTEFGNEFYILRLHDPIRNFNCFSLSFINEFDKDFLSNHSFYKDGIVTINDQPYYQIKFNRTPLVPGGKDLITSDGTIFVKCNNFSVSKMVYTVYLELNKLYEMNLEYKESAGKNYLNYISFNNYFEIHGKLAIKTITPKQNGKMLEVLFNECLDSISVFNEAIYNLKYQKSNININHIGYKSNILELYVNVADSSKIDQLMNPEFYDLKIRKIKGLYDNLINNDYIINLFQFREFFVNQHITKGFSPMEIKYYSNKYIPLQKEKSTDDQFDWEKFNIVLNKALIR